MTIKSLSTAAFLAVTTALAAPSFADTVTLDLWSRADRSGPLRAGNIVTAAQQLNRMFEAAGSDTRVEINLVETNNKGFDADALALLKAHSIGETPDIAVAAHEWIGSFVEAGLAANLEEHIEASPWFYADMIPELWTSVMYKGERYGIPQDSEIRMFFVNNDGKTPLHALITKDNRRSAIDKASYLINKGIKLQVGGEYSIGGLFNSNTNQQVQDAIYEKCDEIVFPALEQVMALPHNHHQPILQALIINNAPPRIIKDLVNHFPDSINTLDSLNTYPIDTAVQHRLSWDDGMEQIVEAFATVQQTTPLNICARHGVQWENGTRNIFESSDMDTIESVDVSTSLYLFMVAAVDDKKYSYDLDSVFHLIKSTPKLVCVQQCSSADEEESLTKKRKRSSFIEYLYKTWSAMGERNKEYLRK